MGDKVAFCLWHSEHTKMGATAHRALFVMALGHHNSKTGALFPSHKTLARELGVKRNAALKAIHELESNGILKATACYTQSAGRTSSSYEFVGLDSCPGVIKAREDRQRHDGEAIAQRRSTGRSNLRLVTSEAANPVSEKGHPCIVPNTGGCIDRDTGGCIETNTRTLEGKTLEVGTLEGKGEKAVPPFSSRSGAEEMGNDSSSKKTGLPDGLRYNPTRWSEFCERWGPIYVRIANDAGISDKAAINASHARFVDYHDKRDTQSGDWEASIRSWIERGLTMQRDHAFRPAASSSSHPLPVEIMDAGHENHKAAVERLSGLASGWGMKPVSMSDTLRRFVSFAGLPSNKGLGLDDAWKSHLEREKREGNCQKTMAERRRCAI
ncbi:helix-turn-helix domain-containing protein [Aureimonas sp. AU40]|uniref:helix-turn-helix domain-containing protein n=1 Tax=Aureimonas sp. AU40 TaxID=1637747 RepID=UPI000781B72D|nr:helix-turn-helix domain-containing protein [Aureimonas sp. AU40]